MLQSYIIHWYTTICISADECEFNGRVWCLACPQDNNWTPLQQGWESSCTQSAWSTRSSSQGMLDWLLGIGIQNRGWHYNWGSSQHRQKYKSLTYAADNKMKQRGRNDVVPSLFCRSDHKVRKRQRRGEGQDHSQPCTCVESREAPISLNWRKHKKTARPVQWWWSIRPT